MNQTPRRVFVGWDRSPLEAAAEWLIAHPAAAGVERLVALPGARAGRLLQEHLARQGGEVWDPPRILTTGLLVDELLRIEGRPAGRLVRTLAWEKALQKLPDPMLRRVLPQRPDSDDLAGWARLAAEVRRLFGEVAAEGMSFGDLCARQELPPGERSRWEALAEAQQLMVGLLESVDLLDPHLARLEALQAGRVRAGREIVLVGVVDTNELLLRALRAEAEQVTALVFAPEEEAAGFDVFGRLQVEHWSSRDLDIDLDRWRIVDRPVDQARAVCATIAELDGSHSAEQISVGVQDSQVVPHVVRRLGEFGVAARDAAGRPLSRTGPLRLLDALAEFVDERAYRAFAALVRHPDLQPLWPAEWGFDPVAAIDDWQRHHLPGRVGEHWPKARSGGEAPARLIHDHLAALSGELWSEGRRSLGDWVLELRSVLQRIYAQGWSEQGDRGDGLRRILGAVADQLAEFEAVPAGLAPSLGAADLLRLLLRSIGAAALPPEAPRPGQATIELLGWLELPLDDAPVLIVTSFEEGKVPQSTEGDAWLPNSLRHQLGLIDDQRRVARDAYALTLCQHSRESVTLVTGRHSAEGDPLLPSRLAFHAGRKDLLLRMRHAMEPLVAAPVAPQNLDLPARPLPRRAQQPVLESMSPTGFRQYLQSPYLFYVERLLKRKTLDDRARELDPLNFGNLAHAVLAGFGESELKHSSDAGKIAAWLVDDLQARARRIYGRDPLPAVLLQLQQMEWRLEHFADEQAAWRRLGWKIDKVEWSPSRKLELQVDGEPIEIRGRIDRIDVNEGGGVAILDYKVGEKAKNPFSEHKSKDRWKDLQLPLYAWMIRGDYPGDVVPELGYASIGRSSEEIRIEIGHKFSKAIIDDGIERACEIVREIRGDADALFRLGKPRFFDETLSALCGVSLLAEIEEGGES